MKISFKIVSIIIVLVSCSFISCGNDRNKPQNSKLVIVKPKPEIKINKTNFYFENSYSMNGYLEGDNFRSTMGKIIHNFNKANFESYFVNTKEYKTDTILDKIRSGNIVNNGSGNSDHQFIFTNAIKNSRDNNLSIVVTDGIYSMDKENKKLIDVEEDIRAAFKDALKVNEIETVVLKMVSTFHGKYYSESCPKKNGIQINQKRPYYILLFGNAKIIDKALSDIVVIKELNGYKQQARFFITKGLKVNYTVLTQGEEKKGKFKSINFSSIVKEIRDAEKFSKGGMLTKDEFLQFAIAVDYSNMSIPKSYLEDKSNYTIDNTTGYVIENVKKIEELGKKTKTYQFLENLNKKAKVNYTHIITVKSKTDLYGDLVINLNINFPSWITITGSEDDCNIKNDSTTTYAFDKLMKGISKAYEEINNKKDFFELKVKIKAD